MHALLNARPDEQGNTPLMQAIAQGNVDQAKMFMQKNRFVREYNDIGQNALMIAMRHKQYDLMRLLVQAGVEINRMDYEGSCVWDFISLSNFDSPQSVQDYYAVKFLIDCGLSVCWGSGGEWTPLMQACFYGESKRVKALLEQGANPNVRTSKGITALLCAIDQQEAQLVELLLAHGAKIDHDIYYSFDTIAWATLYGNASIIRSLLSRTKEVALCDIKRAYELALLLGYPASIKMFHEYFPGIKSSLFIEPKDTESATGQTNSDETFDRAVANNDITMVRTSMIDRLDQLKINQAIFLAVRNSSNEMISFLAAHHGDVNGINDEGLTPLMIACRALDAAMVRSLLANGANPSLIIGGSTALLSVIDCPRTWYINGKDVSGNSAIVAHQIQLKQNEIIPVLLNHGAQPNIKNRKGFTALMEAVKNGYNNVITLLLSAGADSQSTDCEGNTALHLACIVGNATAVNILLSFGVQSLNTTNRFGDTPLRLIERNASLSATSKSQLAALLKKYGAQ